MILLVAVELHLKDIFGEGDEENYILAFKLPPTSEHGFQDYHINVVLHIQWWNLFVHGRSD